MHTGQCGWMDSDLDGWMDGCIYGPKAAGWEKSAPNVPTSPSLGELPRPNHESDQLLFLNSWKITPIFTFLGPFLKANINGGHCFRFFEVSEELIQALVRITVESDYSKLQWTHLSLTKFIVFAGYCIYHDY